MILNEKQTLRKRQSMSSMLTFLFTMTLLMIPAVAIDLPEGAKVGDVAPNFMLTDTENKSVSLTGYAQAKGVILVFTCNTCPYALKYEDRIIALNDKFSKYGYPVIAVNSNDPNIVPEDSPEQMRKRVSDKKFGFPYLIDETQVVAKAYGARKTPHAYVLQRAARGPGFTIEYIGAIDDDPELENPSRTKYVEKAIEALLGSTKPETTFTKAIGCTIKWKKS